MSIAQGSTGHASTHAETAPDVGQLLEEERARVRRRDEEIRGLKKELKRHQEDARRYKEIVRANAPKNSVSELDVIQTVDDFNARIAEYANEAVNGMELSKVTPPKVSLKAIEDNVGAKMKDILESVARGSYRPVGFQLGLEAIFVAAAYSAVQLWSSDPSQNATLRRIYKSVAENETHNASAQWRTLTRRHAEHLQHTPDELSQTLSELAEHVHRAAGGLPETVPDELRSSLRAKIGEIVELCMRLRAQTDEGTFKIVAPHGEDAFFSATMEAVKTVSFRSVPGTSPPGASSPDSPATVLCTTALGLRRSGEEEAIVKAKVVQAVTDGKGRLYKSRW